MKNDTKTVETLKLMELLAREESMLNLLILIFDGEILEIFKVPDLAPDCAKLK